MKHFFKSLVAIATLITTMSVFAKPIDYELRVESLKCVKTSERTTDEIYFSIKSVDNKGNANYIRVPEYPFHLPIKKNQTFSDILLLKNTIDDNTTITYTISLVENDFSVFEMDDDLGAAVLSLSNKNNKLKQTWRTSDNKEDHPIPEYVMTGDNGEYTIKFKVNEKN